MKRCVSIFLTLVLMVVTVPSLAETWLCPKCGQENAGNFCGQCGTARPNNWTCSNCGQVNDTPFCTNCGVKKPDTTDETSIETKNETSDDTLDYNAVSAELEDFILNQMTVSVFGTITATANGESWEIGKYYEGTMEGIAKPVALEFQVQGSSILFKFRQDDAVSENNLSQAQAWAEKRHKVSPDSVIREINPYFEGTDFYCAIDTEFRSDTWKSELIAFEILVLSEGERLLQELAELNAESKPTATPKPTAKPTVKPTATPKAKTYDIPDLVASVQLRPLLLGQKDEQRSTDNNSHFEFYTYDYYNGYIHDTDLKDYLKLIEDEYDFVEVDHKEETIWATSYEYYYYYYTGRKNVSELMVGDKKKYGEEYNLQVRISNRGDSDHCSVTVSFSPELTYAGSGAKQGQWFTDDPLNPTPNPIHTPIPGPKPSPTPYKPPVKCVKCHGQGTISCTQCDGKGYTIQYTNSAIGGKKGETQVTCSKCHRQGTITCPRCHGSKVEP